MPHQPLPLTPILKEKVWGGRRLEHFAKPLPSNAPIGESWELADLRSTNAEGGGGGSASSTIRSGPHANTTLADLMRTNANDILGDTPPAPDNTFPLLVKYLDAAQNLSVQVHPSPDYARNHPDAALKTETWIVLHAEPHAVIYKGIKPGVTEQHFRDAITNNTLPELMNAVPVTPGDVHHLPTGLCHALGAGVLVAEIQTPSDTTFRVYDWGRTNRTLHIDQAMQCLTFPGTEPTPPVRATPDPAHDDAGVHTTTVESNPAYELTIHAAHAGGLATLSTQRNTPPRRTPIILMFTDGRGSIESTQTPAPFAPLDWAKGDTILIPASLDTITIAFDGPGQLIQATPLGGPAG